MSKQVDSMEIYRKVYQDKLRSLYVMKWETVDSYRKDVLKCTLRTVLECSKIQVCPVPYMYRAI